MDTQEINKPKLTIPENPHTDTENAAEFTEHPPVIEQLADAGHAPDQASFDHLTHLENINTEINKAHGVEPNSVAQPSDESIRQIENTQAIISPEMNMRAPSPVTVDNAPTEKLKNNPFSIVKDAVGNILTSLFIHREFGNPSPSGSKYNRHASVSDLQIPTSRQSISTGEDTSTVAEAPQNITSFPNQQEEELPHAA